MENFDPEETQECPIVMLVEGPPPERAVDVWGLFTSIIIALGEAA